MHPIVELGAWRKPLSSPDFSLISMGCLTPYAQSPKHARQLYLRAKMFGIDIPDYDGISKENIDRLFVPCCRLALKNYVEKVKQWLKSKDLLSDDDEKHHYSSYWIAVLHKRAVDNGFTCTRL